jgi:hypothetical protein
MVQEVWEALPKHYAGVERDAFVVMPNHIHGIAGTLSKTLSAGNSTGKIHWRQNRNPKTPGGCRRKATLTI